MTTLIEIIQRQTDALEELKARTDAYETAFISILGYIEGAKNSRDYPENRPEVLDEIAREIERVTNGDASDQTNEKNE